MKTKIISSTGRRQHDRHTSYRDLQMIYEGHAIDIPVRVPDLSTGGMFIPIVRYFPEGAVLKLRFRLAQTGTEVTARAEVKYCLDGVGIGVEFVNLSAEARHAIEEEISYL
jgi:hypothetical protein